ncbi:MAG: prefoldin subunit alpha [bacterium]
MPGDGTADDPRQLLAQRDIVQVELQRMERRMAAIEEAMMEAQRAIATVRGLAEAGGGTHDLLVPVGAGVHVKAQAKGGATILLPLGAGLLTEGKPEDVIAALEERVKGINRSFDEASEQAEQLTNAAAVIEEKLGGAGPGEN